MTSFLLCTICCFFLCFLLNIFLEIFDPTCMTLFVVLVWQSSYSIIQRLSICKVEYAYIMLFSWSFGLSVMPFFSFDNQSVVHTTKYLYLQFLCFTNFRGITNILLCLYFRRPPTPLIEVEQIENQLDDDTLSR